MRLNTLHRAGGNLESTKSEAVKNLVFDFHYFNQCCDPDPFDTDPDPAFHFDPDPAFQFYPDPTVWYGSGSLPFQRGNVPKTLHTFYTSLLDFPCQ